MRFNSFFSLQDIVHYNVNNSVNSFLSLISARSKTAGKIRVHLGAEGGEGGGGDGTSDAREVVVVVVVAAAAAAAAVVEVVVLCIETSSRKILITGLVRYNYTNKWVLI